MNTWKKMPLSRASLPFVLGIFLALELEFNIGRSFWILLPSLLILILFLTKRPKKRLTNRIISSIILCSLLLIGIHRATIFSEEIELSSLSSEEIEASDAFLIELNGKFSEKNKSFKSSATIIGVYIREELIPHSEKTIVYIPKEDYSDSLNRIKHIISVQHPTRISPPKNPSEFNYQKYLKGLGISSQFYLPKKYFHVVSYRKDDSVLDFFDDFRTRNLAQLASLGIKKNEFGVVSALVFGQKEYLTDELYNAYGAAGATHVLAVSGLHVGLIYLILAWMLYPISKHKLGKWLSLFLILLGLWFYAAITGLSPSVLRACTMFSFISIARVSKNNSNIYNTIAASAMLLLLLKPSLIMEVGFQLSYSAVLGILLIQPWLYKLWNPSFYLLDKSWQIITVSIAAQAGTFPLALLYFHQFPNYFMLSNLFVIPLATFILYLTLTLLFISQFSFLNILTQTLTDLLNFVVYFLNSSIKFVETLPMAKTEGIDISVLECFILYLIIGTLILFFTKKSYSSLKWNFGFVILLCALQCKEIIDQRRQSTMYIHVIKNERAISIIQGSSCYFISSKELWENDSKKRFHLSHLWDKKGVKSIIAVDLSDTLYSAESFRKENDVILFKDYKINLGLPVFSNVNKDENEITLLNKISHKMTLMENQRLIADGGTKSQYLLKDEKYSEIEKLEYCLVIE